jgi:uncharacterized protein HemY
MVTLAAVAVLVADLTGPPALGVRIEEARTSEIGPGLIAFTIVVLLAVATFFLVRSMLHHISKVPPTFDGEASDEPSGRDVG